MISQSAVYTSTKGQNSWFYTDASSSNQDANRNRREKSNDYAYFLCDRDQTSWLVLSNRTTNQEILDTRSGEYVSRVLSADALKATEEKIASFSTDQHSRYRGPHPSLYHSAIYQKIMIEKL